MTIGLCFFKDGRLLAETKLPVGAEPERVDTHPALRHVSAIRHGNAVRIDVGRNEQHSLAEGGCVDLGNGVRALFLGRKNPSAQIQLPDRAAFVLDRRIQYGGDDADFEGPPTPVWFTPQTDGILVVSEAEFEGKDARWRSSRIVIRRDETLVHGGKEISLRPFPIDDEQLGVSSAWLESLRGVDQFAPLPLPIMLYGESGVGKEVLARRVHQRSARRDKAFVTVNCGALSSGTLESELFGHERGSFTGASQRHVGVFEQADGGTLFLDEIGELPLDAQTRVLRAVEYGEVRAVGGERVKKIDVRLVAATHRNLKGMVQDGAFREDLFFRLQRLVIRIAPLRERHEDIVLLAEHFLAQAQSYAGPKQLSRNARHSLLRHELRGNARELRNILTTAALRSEGTTITERDIDCAVACVGLVGSTEIPTNAEDILLSSRGNVSLAARTLGVPRTTLRDRIRREHKREAA